MAQAVGKYAANKLLKKHMKQYKGKKVETGNVRLPTQPPPSSLAHPLTPTSQDPYFAMIEDPRKPGKFKKVKKQVPAYIPEHDATILAEVRKSAYRLDMCLFNFLGIRFGWEAVIGIIPELGDAIGAFLAFNVYKKCCKVEGGLSSSVKTRMMINIIADFLVGLVPFVGDLADAAFKANTRNLRLLELELDKKYKPQGAHTDERNLAGADAATRRRNRESGIYHINDPPPATAFEDFDDDEDIQPPAYQQSQQVHLSQPHPPAQQHQQQTGSVRA